MDGEVPLSQLPQLHQDIGVYVDAVNGSDDNNGSSQTPFATIQAAVDSLPKNLGAYSVTIYLAPGEYQTGATIQGFYKHIRFHDLRHTFATASLEHGMDVKTLSTIIGHVSSSTTLNIYTHVTAEMQRTAAAKIDLGIGKQPPKAETEVAPRKPAPSTFQPHKGKRRKPGTGCISQINDHLWEGRYSPIWPDGKKHARNVYYAKTREECEVLLAHLIQQMKAEIAAERERLRQQEYAS